jgi:hypothetical protein
MPAALNCPPIAISAAPAAIAAHIPVSITTVSERCRGRTRSRCDNPHARHVGSVSATSPPQRGHAARELRSHAYVLSLSRTIAVSLFKAYVILSESSSAADWIQVLRPAPVFVEPSNPFMQALRPAPVLVQRATF